MSYIEVSHLIIAAILTEFLTGFLKNAAIIRKPRIFLKERSSFLNELLSCGYCLSLWVSFFISCIFYLNPGLPSFTSLSYLNFVYFWLIVSSFSNAWHGFRDRYLETYKDNRYIDFQGKESYHED